MKTLSSNTVAIQEHRDDLGRSGRYPRKPRPIDRDPVDEYLDGLPCRHRNRLRRWRGYVGRQ